MKLNVIALIGFFLFANSNSVFSQDAPQNRSGQDSGSLNNNMQELNKFVQDNEFKNKNAARGSFVTYFKEAQDYILAGKLDKAEKPLAKLHAMKSPNNYEQARTFLLDSWYESKRGNKERENEALVQLVAIGGGSIDSDTYVDSGMRLLKRQINAQDYGSAIDTLGYLRKDSKSEPELDAIAPAIKKLDDIATGAQDVVQQIKADDKGAWSAKLVRSTFYLDKINGEVSTIDFNCENKTSTLPYKVESVMAVPIAWGGCSVKINSTPNTTFNFVQLVKKPAE